jgi:hypothetical protein
MDGGLKIGQEQNLTNLDSSLPFNASEVFNNPMGNVCGLSSNILEVGRFTNALSHAPAFGDIGKNLEGSNGLGVGSNVEGVGHAAMTTPMKINGTEQEQGGQSH